MVIDRLGEREIFFNNLQKINLMMFVFGGVVVVNVDVGAGGRRITRL